MVNSQQNNQQKNQCKTNSIKSKFTLDDWYYNDRLSCYCSNAQQELARQVIAKSDQVCEQTTETVKKNRDETNHCLDERINEIDFCKQELIRNRNELPLEIDALLVSRDRLVNSLQSLRQNALNICNKCLKARECRLGIDLVKDNVEKQLRQECEDIQCADRLMSHTLERTGEQLRRLKSTVYFIDRDLEDKENNLRIDRHNSTLKETSLNLSIYQGESALEASRITIDEWKEQTTKNIESSTKEVQNAKKIRSHIDRVLKNVISNLIKQKNLTDEAFTHRIEETKIAKEKLEVQHSEIMRQANEMSRNITRLEKTIAEKEGFVALTHTRLGNRCQRPNLELTQDNVEMSLSKEVSDLRKVLAQLQQTLFEAQASLRSLLKMQIQLEEDINIKTNSLNIDEVHCMSMRQSIEYHVF